MLLYEFFQYNMALLFDVDDDDDLWVSISTARTCGALCLEFSFVSPNNFRYLRTQDFYLLAAAVSIVVLLLFGRIDIYHYQGGNG